MKNWLFFIMIHFSFYLNRKNRVYFLIIYLSRPILHCSAKKMSEVSIKDGIQKVKELESELQDNPEISEYRSILHFSIYSLSIESKRSRPREWVVSKRWDYPPLSTMALWKWVTSCPHQSRELYVQYYAWLILSIGHSIDSLWKRCCSYG